ncbi:MAG: AraC family transcriptional regulator [Bacteroidales bacterium]|nr:AraC family transcriptional regulator [Bacteroidales bacterium]MBN2820235.1 AraC family transcriptional regulator [Bacteroidales bacterium]
MKFDLLQTSGISTIVLSCIIGIYFIQTDKERKSKNSLLAGILFIYALMIICSLVLSTGLNSKLFTWAHIGNQSMFLIGPLLYLYIKSQINLNFQFSKIHLVHGIPYIAATSYLILKFNYVHIPITCRSNHILVGSVAFIHTLVYFCFSILVLKRSGFPIRKSFRRVKENKSGLLPLLVYGCFSIWLTKLLFFLIWDISGFYKGCNELVNLYFLVSFSILILFTYLILLKPQYFQAREKYKNSVLTHHEKLKYKNELLALMEKEKAYLNPLISLNHLAKQMAVPSRYLSQVINETLHKSFYDFINGYRIQHCVEYLSDSNYAHKTILEIAYEVGFNSKSTFNTSFIKYAGVTPKEFRKSYLEKPDARIPILV